MEGGGRRSHYLGDFFAAQKPMLDIASQPTLKTRVLDPLPQYLAQENDDRNIKNTI